MIKKVGKIILAKMKRYMFLNVQDANLKILYLVGF